MKCLSNINCKNLKEFDLFGKKAILYYKGRNKKTSLIGNILTFSFIFLYFALFLYKLIRMMKKVDVSFYDTFTYQAEPPAINLSSNIFYGGFAIEHPVTYDVFIDEGIYYPKAYFKRAERKGNNFEWTITEIELERCKLEKFGSFYQEIFKLKPLNNYYCFKNVNFTLEGHYTYDSYSFFYIQFFPCVNKTGKNICKPLEEIDFYLKNTFVSFLIENIELTPKNYKYPVRARDQDIYTTIGKKLYREIHAFFQVVKIETDMDIFGFDEFENFKTEIFLKYDEMVMMDQIIESNIYETGESFCDFTMKLSENVRTERRTYTKLITILGEVGGVFEILFILFRIICSFSVDILYEISLVNKLFDFYLDKKEIILKNYNCIKDKEFDEERAEINKSNPQKLCKILNFQNSPAQKEKIYTIFHKINGENSENKDQFKSTSFNNRSNKYYGNNSSNIFLKSFKNNKILEPDKISHNYEEEHPKIIKNNIIKTKSLNYLKVNGEKNKIIINKIKLNKTCIYFCFCFTRKRNSIQNVLLDEGINIISKRLDIFNLFHKIYEDEKNQAQKLKKNNIEMSNECKFKLKNLFNI